MKLQEKLNIFVANQTLLYTKLHNLHWYVSGPQFFVLHAKFEELYDETTEILDEVAERLLALGGRPVASLKEVLALATLKELPAKTIEGTEAVKIVLQDLKTLLADVKEIQVLAGENDDPSTEDFFIGYRTKYEKTIWMLEATLK
jgi:starvation-inducible DNA-binding protein